MNWGKSNTGSGRRGVCPGSRTAAGSACSRRSATRTSSRSFGRSARGRCWSSATGPPRSSSTSSANDVETWGLDEFTGQGNAFQTADAFALFRRKHHKSKFVVGLLGKGESLGLPDDYFDLVCSVSVVEHVPQSELDPMMAQIARVLRPGGIVVNSYDLCYGQDPSAFFDSHMRAGLEWVVPGCTPALKWDAFDVAFEDPRVVMDYYQAGMRESERVCGRNWATCLAAARKPR